MRGNSRNNDADPLARFFDLALGTVIISIIVATPWAYGTTEPWSVATANTWCFIAAGFGAAGVFQRLIRGQGVVFLKRRMVALVACSALILLWTLIAASNPRATYSLTDQRFEYFTPVPWLPHSYDAAATWTIFWRYLSLGCFFWALCWWLSAPRNGSCSKSVSRRADQTHVWSRIKFLATILVLNTTLVAIEGIIQRAAQSDKLLFMLQPPTYNRYYMIQFGPYVVRNNAAQLFNLIWPLAVWRWLVDENGHHSKLGSNPAILLLLSACLLAACPAYASSRGGTIICILQALVVVALMAWGLGGAQKRVTLGFALALGIGLTVATAANWELLSQRFASASSDSLGGRSEIYKNASQIALDFPWLGIGPGAFGAVYQLYRSDANEMWHAHAHDDWLELKICFGFIGFSLILASVVILMVGNYFGPDPDLFGGKRLLLLVPLLGLCLHAKFDFPLKVYSIQIAALSVAACLIVSHPPCLSKSA